MAIAIVDGHARLCAGCNRNYFLPWLPGIDEHRDIAWYCRTCAERRKAT